MLIYNPLSKKLIALLGNIFIWFTWMKKLKKVSQPGSMVSFWSPRNLTSYLVRAKLYPMERNTWSSKCRSNRCQLCLSVSEMETFTNTVTHTSYKIEPPLIVITNAGYIFWHVRPVLSNMLVVPQTVLDIVRTIISVLTENMWEKRLACKNTSMNILMVKGKMGSKMTFQLHWSMKLTVKILLNPINQQIIKMLVPHCFYVEDDFWITIYFYLYFNGAICQPIVYFFTTLVLDIIIAVIDE